MSTSSTSRTTENASSLRPDPGGSAPLAARRAHERAVRDYYRRGTLGFGLFGRLATGQAGPLPIHRGIWPPGVRTVAQSLNTTDRRVATVGAGYASCLDLGCGVGATLASLAGFTGTTGLHLAGMTLSPIQARMARRHLEPLGPRAAVVVGSYLDPTAYPDLPTPRLLVAVESMVHAADAGSFLHATASYASPGDALLVVDDFAGPAPRGATLPRYRRMVAAVRAGWRAPSFQQAQSFIDSAREAGWHLELDEDWSAWVRSGTGVLRALASLVVRLARIPLPPMAAGLVGGSGLLLGYRARLFTYRFLLFRKAPACAPS